jgi:hypothetical protein
MRIAEFPGGGSRQGVFSRGTLKKKRGEGEKGVLTIIFLRLCKLFIKTAYVFAIVRYKVVSVRALMLVRHAEDVSNLNTHAPSISFTSTT